MAYRNYRRLRLSKSKWIAEVIVRKWVKMGGTSVAVMTAGFEKSTGPLRGRCFSLVTE